MEPDRRQAGEVTILAVPSEFDTPKLPSMDEALEGVLDTGSVRVVVNLARLEFIDSTALGWLVKSAKQLKGAGGELVLSAPSEYFRKVIRAFGIDLILNIYDTDELALRHFEASG